MEESKLFIPSKVFPPGDVLNEKLQEIGMGPKEFALRTNKPEKTIIAVFNGESAITPEMAVLFERVTRIPAHFWLNHQRRFDEFKARKKLQASVDQAMPWAKRFPLTELTRKGWIPAVSGIREKTAQMLEFFAFSTHHAWEEYFFRQRLKVTFRISLKRLSEPYALSAWLRKGELQAEELTAPSYDSKKFKAALPAIKVILSEPKPDYFEMLQQIGLESGVKVVHTPRLNNIAVSGCTRWLNDTPLIQLSGPIRQGRTFAFTFFHEVGHILLHGKKEVFLEHVEYSGKDKLKEDEADAFAEKWLRQDTGRR